MAEATTSSILDESELCRQEYWEIVRKRSGIPRHETLLIFHHECELHLAGRPGLRDKISSLIAPLSEEPYTIQELVALCKDDSKAFAERIKRLDAISLGLAGIVKELEAAEAGTTIDEGTGATSLPVIVNAIKKLNAFVIKLHDGLDMLRTDPDAAADNTMWGLALSGGGVRSAAFNLGVLQGLKESAKLDDVDYLSTVSGGGYIGSSLTYLSTPQLGTFPFSRPTRYTNPNIDWIRRHASYLTPGQGLDAWSLAAAAGRGILVNLVLLVPLLIFLLWLYAFDGGSTTGLCYVDRAAEFVRSLPRGGKTEFLVLGSAFLGFLLLIVFRWKKRRDDPKQTHLRPNLALAVVFWAGVLAVTWLLSLPKTYPEWLSTLLAWFAGIAVASASAAFMWRKADRAIRWAVENGFTIHIAEAFSWLITFTALGIVYGQVESLLNRQPPFAQVAWLMGAALIVKLLTDNACYAYLSASPLRLQIGGHRQFSTEYGDMLKLGAVLLVIGLVPPIHDAVKALTVHARLPELTIESVSSALGAVLTGIGWWLRRKRDERKGFVAYLLRIGLSLVIFAVVLWFYGIAAAVHAQAGEVGAAAWKWAVIWGLAVLLVDINYVSMHRYYRNRLMDAFFGAPTAGEYRIMESLSDNLDLARIDVGLTSTPYPVINSMVETVGSKDQKYRKRGGDSFIFSPLHLGSKTTGWTRSDYRKDRPMSLATAMAISGAAVDPIVGHAYSHPLRIVMALLNVRLGFWLLNPRIGEARRSLLAVWTKLSRGNWIAHIGRELFGFPNEESKYVRLTDGGHFENLGLYELVRRRCDHVIVVDAGADPNWTFGDLARACERIRVDFAVDITIDTSGVQPHPKTKLSHSPYVEGEIRYGTEKVGTLYYVKSTLFKGLPEDVLGYQRVHEHFPDESTLDQFFSEEQFEAYRELGYQSARRMCKDLWP